MKTPLTESLGIETPIICGAMYPCSNAELVAAVSEAGGIGVIQPVSLAFVHNDSFADGLKRIRELTDKPVGFNALVEGSNQRYMDRMRQWIDLALENEVRFFVTALGKPGWVVERVHAAGGVVYHDVTARKWAEKALAEGVDGLICVNKSAGGHAGAKSPAELMDEMGDLEVPLVCAGGIGDEQGFVDALKLGYAGVQLGTRFIATTECNVHNDYKDAIVKAQAEDIVLTQRLTGVPVAIINTPYVQKLGTKASPIARWLLKHNRTKHWVRQWYAIRSAFQLRKASLQGMNYKDFFQAGKSVQGIQAVEPAGDIVRRFAKAAQ